MRVEQRTAREVLVAKGMCEDHSRFTEGSRVFDLNLGISR